MKSKKKCRALSKIRTAPQQSRHALGIQLNRSIQRAALLIPFERSIVNHYPLSSWINELTIVIRRAVFSPRSFCPRTEFKWYDKSSQRLWIKHAANEATPARVVGESKLSDSS